MMKTHFLQKNDHIEPLVHIVTPADPIVIDTILTVCVNILYVLDSVCNGPSLREEAKVSNVGDSALNPLGTFGIVHPLMSVTAQRILFATKLIVICLCTGRISIAWTWVEALSIISVDLSTKDVSEGHRRLASAPLWFSHRTPFITRKLCRVYLLLWRKLDTAANQQSEGQKKLASCLNKSQHNVMYNIMCGAIKSTIFIFFVYRLSCTGPCLLDLWIAYLAAHRVFL